MVPLRLSPAALALPADALGSAGTQGGHLESQAVNHPASPTLARSLGNGDLLGDVASVRGQCLRQTARA
ncbi:hypothetical protein AALO_G00108040 [Alosa alosa]|uniref:Secreted protein n=1 Tax=Alosa alosa TaxID=278164 RepID=A0AAV6GRS1_9TELE|nr:hypothetical protein AALO_G00108040 [Alosa alosa]